LKAIKGEIMSVSVGIIIGRFQVESLHSGHRFLVNTAFQNHKKVIIFIGVSPISLTRHDPMDYPTRERMLRQEFPDAIILPLHDQASDEVWSKQLDTLIKTVVPNVSAANLYGGRDSFAKHYLGQYKTVELDPLGSFQNGTEQRKEIGKVVRSSSDFRSGIIYATQNTFPAMKMAVDIALVRHIKKTVEAQNTPPFEKEKTFVETYETQLLLGRKPHEVKWRFPGGFVDPTDSCLEVAALRELQEETSIHSDRSEVKYLGSFFINDWRFKKTEEFKVMSALFMVNHKSGEAVAGDDLAEVSWHSLDDSLSQINEIHKPLLEALIKHNKG
jgi:bifunctional NMN adenylyltransferase/nudix hydrolase